MADQSSTLAMPTQFALHLMASLVGVVLLTEYITEDSSWKLPLYWRSNFIMNNSFVDISMTIDKDTHLLKLSVGVFHQGENNGDYRYSQGLLTEEVLTNYLESVGIDVETTDPPVMAISMAQALQSIKSFALLEADPTCVCIGLYHQDVEESGSLSIEIKSDCVLTLAAATMLLSNLEASSSSTTIDEENYDTTALEQLFIERTTQQPQAVGSPAPATKLSPEKQVVRPIRPPRGGGVRAGGNRKKKAKTLSYVAAKK